MKKKRERERRRKLTVEGMVCEEELHDSLACLLGDRCVGLDLHAGCCGHGARGHRLGGLLDLNQAHAAVSSNGQTLVVTESWDLDPCSLASTNERRARLNRHLLAIHLKFNHGDDGRGRGSALSAV